MTTLKINPDLDLVLERVVPVPAERVWRAWTEPELLKKWFTPAPWKTIACEMDLRPGGLFSFLMESPEGEKFPNVGCFLEVVPQKRIVWTVALEAGYRPAAPRGDELLFTAWISIEPEGPSRTKYTAIAAHPDAPSAKRHADMGFHEGWGAALDQLVAITQAG